LKLIFYIFVFTLGFSNAVNAQGKIAPQPNGQVKFIKQYPTPATTVVNFDFISGYDKSYNFEIYNFSGKKVYELKNPTSKIVLQLDNFSRGFYYYQLRDKFGRIVETARFLVIK
jgi:hypothetical protein